MKKIAGKSSQKHADTHHLELRNLKPKDYDDIREAMLIVYPHLGAWPREYYLAMLDRFPEGQIGIEDNGHIVAVVLSLIVNYEMFGDHHSYKQIIGDGTLATHDPEGDVLYGIEVFVHPEYQDMRLGRRLYDARKNLCRQLNLRAVIAGARIPGFHEYADKIGPDEYIELVKRKEIRDTILSFQLANDFHVRRIIRDYIPNDVQSHGYAVLVEWNNIFYQPRKLSAVNQRKSTVRVGSVQWQMRTVKSVDELTQHIEFFVDALAGYKCDFALFPEFFNIALMGLMPQATPADAIRELALYTAPVCDAMRKLALSYNINIVAGSMPVYENSELYNVSFLMRRDGSMGSQYKLHPTPDERAYWGVRGGDRLKAFDTDAGRIGILVCYDCEFPEPARILADQGMQILMVPFWTDTKNGYQRVRLCAQARAIENECYVAITGSCGNLPKVENADIQYSQSAVFTPSDFAFPHDGVAAESTPNTEMTLIVDLDLNKLKLLHERGAVRNLLDRRRDLYRLEWRGPQ